MRASLQGFFIAGALLATAASLQAQGVTVRCGGGTVQTGGFTINQAGEVVFSEQSLACNVQQTGTCLPDPLQLSIGAPAAGTTIDVGTSAQTVQFSAQITNYSPTFDTCTLNVQPAPNTSWQAVTLQPNGSGAASTNVQFAQGAAAGTYSFQLSCSR